MSTTPTLDPSTLRALAALEHGPLSRAALFVAFADQPDPHDDGPTAAAFRALLDGPYVAVAWSLSATAPYHLADRGRRALFLHRLGRPTIAELAYDPEWDDTEWLGPDYVPREERCAGCPGRREGPHKWGCARRWVPPTTPSGSET